MLLDVLRGAVKMQLTTYSAWKLVAAVAMAGVLGAAMYSWTMPKRYVSTAVVEVQPGVENRLEPIARIMLGGSSWGQAIKDGEFEEHGRAWIFFDKMIHRIKGQDFQIQERGAGAVFISITEPDAAFARGSPREG